jgi:hypothetical protein
MGDNGNSYRYPSHNISPRSSAKYITTHNIFQNIYILQSIPFGIIYLCVLMFWAHEIFMALRFSIPYCIHLKEFDTTAWLIDWVGGIRNPRSPSTPKHILVYIFAMCRVRERVRAHHTQERRKRRETEAAVRILIFLLYELAAASCCASERSANWEDWFGDIHHFVLSLMPIIYIEPRRSSKVHME